MTRLRLGHSALNKNLEIIGKHHNGLCEECQEDETIEHVLLSCRKYEMERNTMMNKMRDLGEKEVNIKSLLRMQSWKYVKILMEFLRNTDLIDRI